MYTVKKVIIFPVPSAESTVKKVIGFPVPSRDVTYQTLPVAGIIRTGKWLTFYYSIYSTYCRARRGGWLIQWKSFSRHGLWIIVYKKRRLSLLRSVSFIYHRLYSLKASYEDWIVLRYMYTRLIAETGLTTRNLSLLYFPLFMVSSRLGKRCVVFESPRIYLFLTFWPWVYLTF